VQKYLAKLSGPLLDRIDLHVGVSRVPFDELVGRGPAETSATIRARVEAARERQTARSHDGTASTNAAIAAADVRRLCPLDADTLAASRPRGPHDRRPRRHGADRARARRRSVALPRRGAHPLVVTLSYAKVAVAAGAGFAARAAT
jgi:hypothetical protein